MISSPTARTISKELKSKEKGTRTLTDLSRRPRNPNLTRVHAIHHQLTTPTNIVNRVLKDLLATSSLNNNIESIRILSLESVELSLGSLTRQLNVLITSTKLLSQIHLQTTRSNNNNIATAVLAQHLSQHQTSRTSTEDQNGRAHLRGDLVQTVGSAGGGLEKSCVDVRKVLDLEDSTG